MLVLVLVGTADFARVFYTAIELNNAARAGAQIGALSAGNTGNAALITGQVNTASPDMNINGGITVSTPAQNCWCATDDMTTFTSTACTSSCPTTSPVQHLVVSVTVTATKAFTTISPLPGIPHLLTISRSATMRAR